MGVIKPLSITLLKLDGPKAQQDCFGFQTPNFRNSTGYKFDKREILLYFKIQKCRLKLHNDGTGGQPCRPPFRKATEGN